MTSEPMGETLLKSVPARPPRSPGLILGLALLTYLAFGLLLPWVPLPAHRPPLIVVLGMVVVTTAAFMLLQLWLAQAVVSTKPGAAVSAGLAVLCVALLIGANLFAPAFLRLLLINLMITLGCAFLGILLARIIREPNVLLPVALVAIPIDFIGAMTSIGFTNTVVAHNPALVKAVSVAVPTVGGGGQHAGGLHPIGFIGPGDALFTAFFFAVVLRLGMNRRGTFWWMYGLLTLAMLIVLSPFGVNIAALVPMGVAVIIANFRFFKLKRDEVFATLYAGVFIVALVTGFYYYSHSRLFRPVPKGNPNAARSAPNSAAPSRPAGN